MPYPLLMVHSDVCFVLPFRSAALQNFPSAGKERCSQENLNDIASDVRHDADLKGSEWRCVHYHRKPGPTGKEDHQ